MNRALLGLLLLTACSGTHDPVPEGFRGYMHQVGGDVVDAMNLQLRDDGTYTWVSDGCDVHSHDQQAWALQDGVMRLDDRYTLAAADGGWTVDPAFFGATRFEPGGVCAICGNLGPASLAACDVPYGFDGGG